VDLGVSKGILRLAVLKIQVSWWFLEAYSG